MKKNRLYYIAMLLLFHAGNSAAQTPAYNSSKSSLTGIASNYERSCEFMSRYLVTYSHSTSSSVHHFFTVQDMHASSPTVKRFPLNIGYEPSGISIQTSILYQVNDMRMSDNGVCYFCGSRVTETHTAPITTESIGFIGFFSINDVLNNTGTCTILHIVGTGSLSRIEPGGSYEQIFAVGNSDSYSFDPFKSTPASLLVGLEYDYANAQWKYDMVTPISNTEQFTDVVNCGGIIVSSIFLNDNYHIGLRHTKNGPLRNNLCFNMLSYCNIYDMQTATTPIGTKVAYRKNNDHVLMASRGSGLVTMAHSCYDIADGIAAYSLYAADIDDARISEARYTSYSEYVSLSDIATRSGDSKALFLAINNSSNKCQISQTDWYASGSYFPYYEIAIPNSVLVCRNVEEFFNSSHSNEYLYLEGYNSSGQPTYFAEKFNFSGIIQSCLPNTISNQFVKLDTPTFTRDYYPLDYLCKDCEIQSIDTYNIVSTSVTISNTCSH